jgi:hypothetical protein
VDLASESGTRGSKHEAGPIKRPSPLYAVGFGAAGPNTEVKTERKPAPA